MTSTSSILLAEDNSAIRRSITDVLIKKGYFVTEAVNGIEAIDIFRKIQPDLVISDLRIPEIDGLEFLKIVKVESPETPFIIISGEGTVDDAIEGLRLGAWNFLTKPINPWDLLSHTVGKALENARLIREAHTYQTSLDALVEKRTTDLQEQNKQLQQEIIERLHQKQLVKNAMSELEQSFKEKEMLHSQLLQAHKLESVGQLASGIAHEINTPAQFVSSNISFLDEAFRDITNFIGSLTSAETEAQLPVNYVHDTLKDIDWEYLNEEIPKAFQQSQEGLLRISSIVRAMKEFSHPGSKDAEPSDINHLIETTVIVARNEWKYVSDVVFHLAPDLPRVHCMSGAISQVMLNLLVNAAHSISEKLGRTPEGAKGTITITTEADGSSVFIHLTDTGCGIPEDCRAKIFEPFFTTKEVGMGTGQGLAIAYDVVTRKHGGDLTFKTEIGEGTMFTIKLPIVKLKNGA